MSFSIINNSFKKSYLTKNIQNCSLQFNKLNGLNNHLILNRVVLTNNSTRNLNLNTSNLLHSPPTPIISSLAELKQYNSVSFNKNNYLFHQEFINRKFYSTFDDFDDKEDKDQKSDSDNTFSTNSFNDSTIDKENNNASLNNKNDDIYYINNNNNNEINNETKKNEKKEDKREINKDEIKEFYSKIRDNIVDKLNKIPSTLDKASTFKFDRENLEKLSSASPYLLWTSFILASSMSAYVFKQLTGSSIISHAVMIGIDFPAVVNVSHLYNQGGKMIAKELSAEQCPSTSELYEVVENVSREIGLNHTPDVYIHPSEEINALTAGIKNDNSIILLTKGLLNNLKPGEIR